MKSFKTELNLNNKQRTLMAKHAGVARHAYNWGLGICIEAKEKGEKRPSANTLHKRLVAEVKSEYKWYYEVSKCAPQQALRDLDSAFKNFFTVKGRGFPRFKKKGRNDSFYLEGNIQIRGNQIRLPRIGFELKDPYFLKLIPKTANLSLKLNGQQDGAFMRQLWQWFKSFLGQIFNSGDKILTGSPPQGSASQSNPHHLEAVLVPLSDADYEFLFSQLMEGVAQGWQGERVALFFEKLGDRTSSDRWLEWLRVYRARLLGTRSPQTQHANQMMKVGEMIRSLPQWQPVGEATYEIGLQLRLRSQGGSSWEYMSPSLTANPAPATSAIPLSQPPVSGTVAFPVSSELLQEKVEEMNTVDVESSDSQSSPLFYPEMVADLWDDASETPIDRPVERETVPEQTQSEPVKETPVEVPLVEREVVPAQPLSEPVSDLQPESATSLEDYIRQQPVINLAYSAHGKQWTQTVSLNELLGKLTEMPNLIGQFSQQVGINSQNPEEIVEAIYQQLYQIYQQHQGNSTVDEAILLLNEGMQQAKAGRYADAIATWDRALNQQPGLYKAWLNRGNALVMLRQPQAAIESYDKALELQPGLYEAWGNKGVALLNLGKCEEAIAAFDRAIEFKSDYHQAWDNRGLALRELGQINEAIASFDRAIAINPDDPSVLKHQVETLKLRGSQG